MASANELGRMLSETENNPFQTAACKAIPLTCPDGLACPGCSSPLRGQGAEIVCSQCQKSWPVIDGVPHFIDDFPYWGEIPLQEMQEVNELARRGSWKSALLNHKSELVQSASEMILNLERANWHWLFSLNPKGRVLDIGAGMGANTHALAIHYSEVVAIEPVLERVQFMTARFAQEGLRNVHVVRTSLWDLPFPPESFDLIVMNGVLEWVAEGRNGDPKRIQQSSLARMYSLLRPGGCLYVGIENRFALGHFVGHRDPHCGLPWVTVLPRPLANRYAKTRGQDGYRNYLYSSRGYRKLLSEAGFSNVEIYLALPSYNHPRFFIPLNDDLFFYHSRVFAGSSARLSRRLVSSFLQRVGLLKYVQYSYAIGAWK